MPVTIKSTGGGSVTMTAANTASDYTLTIPAATGTILQSGTAVTAAQGGTGLTSAGASGNVLTSDGTNWTSAAAPASLTLLATLATTSGTTQAATGLATTYTVLVVVFDAVTPSTSSQISIELSSTNGSAYGSAVGITVGTLTTAASGRLEIWRANASATAHPTSMVGATSSFQYGFTSSNQTSLSTDTASAINAIRFSISAGNFNGGNIYIYGWK